MARGALVEAVHAGTAGVPERLLDGRRQVEVTIGREPRPERRPHGSGDVLAHLVAARPDARPDRRRHVPAAEGGDRCRHDSGEEAAPADVREREGGPAAQPHERDGHAVGGDYHDRFAELVGPDRVRLDAAPARAHDIRAVHLPWPADTLWMSTGRGVEPLPVLLHELSLVAAQEAEVERRVRTVRDTSGAPRGAAFVRASLVP